MKGKKKIINKIITTSIMNKHKNFRDSNNIVLDNNNYKLIKK